MTDRFQLMVLPPHIEATVTYAAKVKRKGLYAARPGTGPVGETCGSCKHIVRAWNGRYRKCDLVRRLWTHGPGTDIKARSPACSKWEHE